MRIVLLVVLAGALAVAAVAVVAVLGVFEAALMVVVLALLAFVVIAVPNKPGGNPVDGRDGRVRPSIAGGDGTDARGDGRGAEQLAQVRNPSAVPSRS